MQTFFVEIKCKLGKTYDVASRLADAEIASEIYSIAGHFDILADEAVRQGLKEYSDWPTYPQLFYRGELVGGCDIVLAMAASGELKSALAGPGPGEQSAQPAGPPPLRRPPLPQPCS